MKVGLFVTGELEQRALSDALARLFQGHEFACVPSMPGAGPFDSFTSNRLPPPPISPGVRSRIDVLVARAAAEVTKEHGPDLLLIVDDLELDNANQPEVVVECFREGIRDHLDKLDPRLRRRTAEALRTKASLHFAVPMIEAWLFADPGGPARAGVPAGRCAPRLPCAPRFEDFSTDDPNYLADDCSGCERWTAILGRRRLTKAQEKANRPEWCRGREADGGSEFRSRHPKRYLAWLCRDPKLKKCSSYREVSAKPEYRTGAAALRELDWSAVLSESVHMPFLAAMIDDLAKGLDVDSPLPAGAPLAPETQLGRGVDLVLRNI